MYESEQDSPLVLTMLDHAEEATQAPPLPVKGIPKQKTSRLLRRIIKEIVLPFVILDVAMQRLAKHLVRPPFKRKGKCKKRGNCCYYVLVRASSTWYGKLFYFWHTQIHGFYPRVKKPQNYSGKKVWVMGCRYLTSKGQCSQYRLRPSVCRQWPLIERFGPPHILKGCGFYSHPPFPLDEKGHARETKDKESPLKVLQ